MIIHFKIMDSIEMSKRFSGENLYTAHVTINYFEHFNLYAVKSVHIKRFNVSLYYN